MNKNIYEEITKNQIKKELSNKKNKKIKIPKTNIIKILFILVLLFPLFLVPNLFINKINISDEEYLIKKSYKVDNYNFTIKSLSNIEGTDKILYSLANSYNNKINKKVFYKFINLSNTNEVKIGGINPGTGEIDLMYNDGTNYILNLYLLEREDLINYNDPILSITIPVNLITNNKLKLFYDDVLYYYDYDPTKVREIIEFANANSVSSQVSKIEKGYADLLAKNEIIYNLLLEKGITQDEIENLKAIKNYKEYTNGLTKLEEKANELILKSNALLLKDLEQKGIIEANDKFYNLSPVDFKKWGEEKLYE